MRVKTTVRRLLPHLLLAGAVLVLFRTPSQGQGAWSRLYEPFVPVPEFREAFQMLARGEETDAIQRFAQLAAQHPGTTLGAVSLLNQANWVSSDGQAVSVLQSVLVNYPQSRFEIDARLGLLSRQHRDRPDQFIEAADQLAQTYGGPSLRTVERPNQSQAGAQVHSLPLELQYGLLMIYSSLHDTIAHELHQYARAASVALFNRTTFANIGSDAFLNALTFDLVKARYGVWNGFERKVANPTVRILNPKEGKITGPRPKIRWETTVGDFTYAQVSTENVRMTLDGQDLSSQLVVRSKVRRPLKTKARNVFERLRFTFRPVQRLSAGSHTVSIVVPTQGHSGSEFGITRLTWSFRVGRDRDDNYDERSDDDEDNDGWENEKD